MIFRKEHRVFLAIRRRLLLGHWQPETKIKPADVATSLGVSVSPVREALIRLTERGLLTNVENLGFVVSPFDPVTTSHYCTLMAHLYSDSITRIANAALLDSAAEHIEREVATSTVERGSPADAYLHVTALYRRVLLINPYRAIADQIEDVIMAHAAVMVGSEGYYRDRLSDLARFVINIRRGETPRLRRAVQFYFKRRSLEIMRATARLAGLPSLTGPALDPQR